MDGKVGFGTFPEDVIFKATSDFMSMVCLFGAALVANGIQYRIKAH